jgi:hypothetical protein
VSASADDCGTRGLVQLLSKLPRAAGTVRVAVSPSLRPGLFFYRRRYHLDWIQIVPVQKDAVFHLIDPSGEAERGLTVLERGPGAILAAN